MFPLDQSLLLLPSEEAKILFMEPSLKVWDIKTIILERVSMITNEEFACGTSSGKDGPQMQFGGYYMLNYQWLPIRPPMDSCVPLDWLVPTPSRSYHVDTFPYNHSGLGAFLSMYLSLLHSFLPSTHPPIYKTHMNYLSIMFMALL